MRPADERLDGEDLAGAHVDLRLVVQHELAALEGDPHRVDAPVARAVPLVGVDVEEVVAVLAGQLGPVDRLLGLAQQLLGVDPGALRVDRRADAAGDRQPGARDGQRLLDERAQLLEALLDVGAWRVVAEHHRELVTVDAADASAVVDEAEQPVGHGHERLVAGGATVHIVERGEGVEVEAGQREARAVLLSGEQLVAELAGEALTVEQAGELVVLGDEVDELLLRLASADVEGEAPHVHRLAGPATHEDPTEVTQPHPPAVAVTQPVLRLVASPGAGQQLRPRTTRRRGVVGVDQLGPRHARQPAELAGAIAEQPLPAVVDGDLTGRVLPLPLPRRGLRRLDRVVQAGLLSGQPPAGGLALGDVEHRADRADGIALPVVLDLPPRVHPPRLPVDEQTVLDLAAALLQGRLPRREHRVAVIGVQQRRGQLHARRDLRVDAVEPVALHRPFQLSGAQVHAPAADPGDRLRVGEIGL